jgi:hypothetical protein
MEDAHLSYGVGDLGPEQIDVFVEAVEGEAAQRRIWLGEEAHEAGSGGDADRGHGGEERRSWTDGRKGRRCSR